jgi:hypothetical protein
MKVRIESDGDTIGTRVFTEDGREITDMILEIEWEHRAGGLPAARLYLSMIPLSGPVVAKMIGPGGKEVRRIEYSDGSEDLF